MNFGSTARAAGHALKAIGLAAALLMAPQAVLAAAPAAATAPAITEPSAATTPAAPAVAAPVAAAPTPAAAVPAAPAIDPNDPHFKVAPGGYTPMLPTPGKGMPVAEGIDVQNQYSPIGQHARPFHFWLLVLALVISAFVLGLLLFVVVRFNSKANPVASKTSHNTLIEIVWTLVPVLILVGVAIPSIDLLAKQFKPAPEKALTIKATGNQWFWSYTYPDNGGFELVSNMLKEADEVKPGEQARTDADGPAHLAADVRMVVPVGEPIRMQVTAADVIHSFAMPSLWFKIDAVPGRINELVLFVKEPGVYYGQCSELCGARHGYMPIVIEALPRDKYNAWVLTQSGGKIDGMPEAPAAAPTAAASPPAGAAPAGAAPAPAASATPAPAA